MRRLLADQLQRRSLFPRLPSRARGWGKGQVLPNRPTGLWELGVQPQHGGERWPVPPRCPQPHGKEENLSAPSKAEEQQTSLLSVGRSVCLSEVGAGGSRGGFMLCQHLRPEVYAQRVHPHFSSLSVK